MKFTRFITIAALMISLRSQLYADPISELTSFSAFKSVDRRKLIEGEALTVHLPAMKFARGLSTQFCYLVPASLQKTVELHEYWNATQHPELKVYMHGAISPKPLLANFIKVGRAPDNDSTRALFSANQKLESGQMSKIEATFLKPGTNLGNFWSDLLWRRAGAFASDGLSQEPPYAFNGETIRVTGEIEQLLNEQPKIRDQFKSLVESLSQMPPVRQMYWELADVEGTAAFSLGALCAKDPTDTWQAIDLHYYASGGYFVMMTFYQMWPIVIGAEHGTLVWRCDLLSAPSVADLHGVERLASDNAMAKEIHQTIDIFLKDARVK